MISIKNVSVRYEEKPAVDAISLEIEGGRISGIIGPNGAGKSTLIKTCLGLINEYAGEIHFDGHDIRKNKRKLKARLGYAPEDAVLMPYLTGIEFLQLIGELRRTADPQNEIGRYLSMLGLTKVKDDLIINYSHGMRQKLSLAAALLGEPDYIFLDEALNGLDSLSLFHLKNHLMELAGRNKHLVISSHVIPLVVQWCDPLILMHEGKLVRIFTQKDISSLEEESGKPFEMLYIEMITNHSKFQKGNVG